MTDDLCVVCGAYWHCEHRYDRDRARLRPDLTYDNYLATSPSIVSPSMPGDQPHAGGIFARAAAQWAKKIDDDLINGTGVPTDPAPLGVMHVWPADDVMDALRAAFRALIPQFADEIAPVIKDALDDLAALLEVEPVVEIGSLPAPRQPLPPQRSRQRAALQEITPRARAPPRATNQGITLK